MVSFVIETNGLSFSFNKKERVLDALSLQVPQGCIYGFLGPNGAGKTTTLKLLLGLIRLNPNPITIFGMPLSKHRTQLLSRIGSLIELPSLYGHLTGAENLEVFRLAYGGKKERIAEVLAITRLSHARDKKAKSYSLGMKQRLAIAISLLHDPELLILDEPTNGLDPTGIIETRDLIIRLNQEFNKTILVSSHLLNEVEKVATDVGIIHRGRLMFQGTLGELQRKKSDHTTLEVQIDNMEKAISLLNGRTLRKISDSTLQIHIDNREAQAAINALLVTNDVKVYKLDYVRSELEELFIQIISQ